MKLKLSPQTEKAIEARLNSGKYESAEAVIAAAMGQLDQSESLSGFKPGELDALLAAGEKSGDPIPAAGVFAELKALRAKSAS